jgi:hypothetical protein
VIDVVGTFRFTTPPGLTVTSTLYADGTWRSSHPLVQRWLDFLYAPGRNSSPAHGHNGRMVLELAAAEFGAAPEPPPEGWLSNDPNLIF